MIASLVRKTLQTLIDSIDSGNSSISEEEGAEILDCINRMTSPWLSKYEACNHLHVSRATFDRMVADGCLPQGRPRAGFKELAWRKYDLERVRGKV